MRTFLCFLAAAGLSITGLSAQQLVVGEYFFDVDPGYGSGTSIEVEGASDREEITFSPDVSELASGYHRLYLRFQDDDGEWSVPRIVPFFKTPSAAKHPMAISSAEMTVSSSRGFDETTELVAGDEEDFSTSLKDLDAGTYSLEFRATDGIGMSSIAHRRMLTVLPKLQARSVQWAVTDDGERLTGGTLPLPTDGFTGETSLTLGNLSVEGEPGELVLQVGLAEGTGDAVPTLWTQLIEVGYRLAWETIGEGMVEPSSDEPLYRWGETVTLSSNSEILRWGGDRNGGAGPLTVTIGGHTELVAQFSRGDTVLDALPFAERAATTGYYNLDGFGDFFTDYFPWVYHHSLGYLYFHLPVWETLYAYSYDLEWVYTGSGLFPYLYSYRDARWYWSHTESADGWLYDFTDRRWYLRRDLRGGE